MSHGFQYILHIDRRGLCIIKITIQNRSRNYDDQKAYGIDFKKEYVINDGNTLQESDERPEADQSDKYRHRDHVELGLHGKPVEDHRNGNQEDVGQHRPHRNGKRMVKIDMCPNHERTEPHDDAENDEFQEDDAGDNEDEFHGIPDEPYEPLFHIIIEELAEYVVEDKTIPVV